MRTDDLIRVIVADSSPSGGGLRRAMTVALMLGGSAAAALLVATIGLRDDLLAALTTWRFDLKLLLLAAVMLSAFSDCLRLSDPTETRVWTWTTGAPLLLLGAAVVAELVTTPQHTLGARLVGTNAALCLAAIPLLASAPFVTLMWALRRGAPTSPGAAGAAAGRLAAALGALLYGMHCFDDSPLFVATWYSIAIGTIMVAGLLVGRRLLRW